MLRGAFVASFAVLGLLGCASDSPKPVSSIGLNLAIPKGLVDVDRVRLYVFDRAEVQCKGATITVPPENVDRVFEIGLARCAAKWCGTGTLERNPERVLTFYVEGRFDAQKGGFTACAERAVDQDPLQIDLRAQPLIEGVKCGDVAVGYGETCDPGGGTVDEACDGAMCQTKEILLARRTGEGFYRGRPGRKTGVGIRWSGDKFFGLWSDQAVGGSGNDGAHEVTVRRMSAEMLTETAPAVLAGAVRLPASGGPTSGGVVKRGSVDTAPTLVPLAGGNLLFTFLRDGKLNALVTSGSFNVLTPDAAVTSGPTQSAPHAAANGAGDALIVFVEAGAIKSVHRKADGTFGTAQTLAAGGSQPRVASAGADFVVVWGDGNDIQMRRVGGADGLPKTSAVKVNAAKDAGVQDQPAIAAFDTGEFIVAWRDAASGGDIRVQKFDSAGAPTGTEIGEVLNDLQKDGEQDQPAVAAGKSPAGLRFYLVAWRTVDNIAARFVKADESGYLVSHAGATTSEFTVAAVARPRSSPAVAVGPGHCAIAWADETDEDAAADDDRVRARRFPMPDPPR